ncbi:hypothetical protein ACCT25_37540, partial [Rhizobium ruizarguesonis]
SLAIEAALPFRADLPCILCKWASGAWYLRKLHWNGEAVLLEKRIRLETYQIALASLATAGSLLSGIHPFGHSFGWW